MKRLLALALCLASTSIPAVAQGEVVGLYYDGANRQMFTTSTTDFAGDWSATLGFMPQLFYGFDFDAAGTTLYGITYSQGYFGTLDESTGAFTNMGLSGLPTFSVYGMTAHPDGSTWYVICRVGSDTQLYSGTMGAGTWTPVGPPIVGQIFYDIACDSTGQLFAQNAISDELYSIDPVGGAATLIGPIGLDLQYQQGFDFDWFDDTLYATTSLSLGVGGGSKFVSIDTSTGAATILADAGGLYGQAQMAIKPTVPALFEAYCDPAIANSSGLPAELTGDMSAPTASNLHLEVNYGPHSQIGYFLVGTGATHSGVMISAGRLCLTGMLGRYNVGGGELNSVGRFDASGLLQNLVGTSSVGSGFDVPATVPLPGMPTILTGDTYYFQLWYRDPAAGPTFSNFSNALSVTW